MDMQKLEDDVLLMYILDELQGKLHDSAEWLNFDDLDAFMAELRRRTYAKL